MALSSKRSDGSIRAEDPSERFRALYRRHLQGAIVRSGASALMWMFASGAYYAGVIGQNHLIGISLSVAFLILMNPPTLLLLKRINNLKYYGYASLSINLLEILGYTAIIYCLGGTEAVFLTPIYAAVINYVGVMAPRSFPFIIAAFASAAFGAVVPGEISGLMTTMRVTPSFVQPALTKIIYFFVVAALLFIVAYISAYTGGVVRKQARRLRDQNDELVKKTAELERAQESLKRSHHRLEALVEERTRDLRTVNERLILEIKERERVAESLKASQEMYRLLFDSVGEVVFTLDRFMTVTSVTPSVERLLGYKPADLEGKSINDVRILSPKHHGQAVSDITSVLSGQKVSSSVYEFICKDGTIKIGEVSGAPIMRDGEVVGIISVGRDITQRVKDEKEKNELSLRLQRAQRMEALGTLAGGVAHDLNNVLSGLVSYPDLILMDLPTDSPLRRPILTMKESGKRAAAIVQDLLTLARRGVTTKKVIKLNDVVEEYLRSSEFNVLKAHYPGVRVQTHLANDLLRMEGSALHIEKTVMNLVLNAAEAMPEGGIISIRTQNKYIDKPIGGYDKGGGRRLCGHLGF